MRTPSARRRAAAIAVPLVAALTLGACSSGSSPAPSPSLSAPVPAKGQPPGVAVVAQLGSAQELRAPTAKVPGADPGAIAAAEQAFSLALLAKSATGTGNTTVSPASLAAVLAMLQQGARGQTAQQIAAALHVPGMSAAEVGAAWHALATAWNSDAAAGHIDLATANSLWQQKGFRLEPAFLRALASYFDAGVWQADFAGDMPGALDAINRWTSANTHGKITKLFDSLPAQTQLVLADAVYFKAAWQTPFEGSDTAPATFTTAAGTSVRTPFMNASTVLPAARTSTYDAVELPYRGGRFSALAVMPTQQSLRDFVAGLTSDRLAAIVSGLSGQAVALALPKFTTTSTLELNSVLQQLGISAAFGDGADFSGITSSPLKISEVLQRSYLKVAEKGTEAAAVTGAVLVPTAVPAAQNRITLDHPFLFLIRDNTTGAILFASEINNPAA